MKKNITILLLLIPLVASSQNCGIQKRVVKKILNPETLSSIDRDTINVDFSMRFLDPIDSFCNEKDSFHLDGTVITFENREPYTYTSLAFHELEITDKIINVEFDFFGKSLFHQVSYKNNNNLSIISESAYCAKGDRRTKKEKEENLKRNIEELRLRGVSEEELEEMMRMSKEMIRKEEERRQRRIRETEEERERRKKKSKR